MSKNVTRLFTMLLIAGCFAVMCPSQADAQPPVTVEIPFNISGYGTASYWKGEDPAPAVAAAIAIAEADAHEELAWMLSVWQITDPGAYATIEFDVLVHSDNWGGFPGGGWGNSCWGSASWRLTGKITVTLVPAGPDDSWKIPFIV